MSILVMDELWVREPRLMVPGLGPIGPVKLDPSFPYKVICAYAGHDVLTGRPSTDLRSRTVYRGNKAAGFGATFGTSNDDRIVIPHGNYSGDLIVINNFHANGAGEGGYGRLYAGAVSLNHEYEANVYKIFRGLRFAGLSSITDQAPVNFVAFWPAVEGSVHLWYNGVLRIYSTSGSYSDAAGDMYLGNRSDLVRCWDGTLSLFAMISGPYALAESLARNPYQFLIPA